MTDSEFYTDAQRAMQDGFEARPLADRLELAIVADELNENQIAFISSRDFFYLSTVDGDGMPTVSHKGGDVGHCNVVDSRTLAFPIYDGNGMFLSAGNMSETGKVGMLFIDYVVPQRVRVQGHATVHEDDELMAEFPGAILICRVAITKAFINCARYIHKHERVETSKYVPDENGEQPFASWKRIDGLQDALAPADMGRAEHEGGVITEEQYGKALMQGES